MPKLAFWQTLIKTASLINQTSGSGARHARVINDQSTDESLISAFSRLVTKALEVVSRKQLVDYYNFKSNLLVALVQVKLSSSYGLRDVLRDRDGRTFATIVCSIEWTRLYLDGW